MRVFSAPSLKSKILAGLLCTAGVSSAAALMGVWTLFHLEERLKIVNLQYVPLLKVLGQLESHQYFLDHDLNGAFEAKRTRLANFHAQAMENRIRSLARLYATGERENPEIQAELAKLERDFSAFLVSIEPALAPTAPESARTRFSEARAQFKNRLRELMRDVERGIRDTSLGVQEKISRAVTFVTALLAVFSLLGAGIVAWVDRLLKPLQDLTEIVKDISSRGLTEAERDRLLKVDGHDGELRVFAREFSRMASSLIDRNRELERQRQDLERAHQGMAEQNEELRRTQARLVHEEKLGLVGRLSAQMAHEIRNPLNAMGLHLETLEFDISGANPGAEESIACIKREIRRLAEITESYLELARAPRLTPARADLNELVIEVGELYAPLVREAGVDWKYDLGDLPALHFDRQQMTLVLGNLVKNAVEALADVNGAKQIRVATRFDSDAGAAEIEVHDNGAGISGESAASVFSPFYTTKASGTGLGLAHSKQIVNAHGGEIKFWSGKGGGTSFFVKLPLGSEANA